MAATMSSSEALAAAIKERNAALVREVIARNPELKSSIDEPSPHYSFDAPALIAAVHTENREVIEALLDAGANINARTRWWAGGFGVLDSANPQLATYLISRGAIVDIHAAARLGMMERVRELLATNRQLVHARGGDGQLPLHFAATVEIAALLLEHGADIDARDIDHESTAAQYMASSKYYMDSQATYRHDVARFLISRGAQTDILMASAVGDLALVERILNDNPDTIRVTVNEQYFPKRDPRSGGSIYFFGFGISKSPHMVARRFGHTAVFELLMERSAPWLRLVHAAEMGDRTRLELIFERYPSVIAKLPGNAARRIVGLAVRNNAAAVELLLERGWPSSVALDNNQTALHYAAWHGNLAMVRTLIAHQAPVNIFEAEHGGSPLMLADIDRACQTAGVWPHAVFSGHSHNYQRYTRTMNNFQIPFLVAGNGGHSPLSSMRATYRTPYVIDDTLTLESYDDTDYGYLRVVVNAETMRIEYHPESDGGTTKTPDDDVTITLATRTIS